MLLLTKIYIDLKLRNLSLMHDPKFMYTYNTYIIFSFNF